MDSDAFQMIISIQWSPLGKTFPRCTELSFLSAPQNLKQIYTMIVLVLRALGVKVCNLLFLLFLCNFSNAFSNSSLLLRWRQPACFLVPDESVGMETLIYLREHVLKLLRNTLKVVGITDISPKMLLISKFLSGIMKI